VKKTKGLLFDSDNGSSESEAEDQQMFQLRPEFEGKAGSKVRCSILYLQLNHKIFNNSSKNNNKIL